MKKVLVSDSLSVRGVEIFKQAEGIEVDVNTGLSPAELKEIIGQYDALVIRSATKATADLLEAADNLKVIGRAGIGVDNVDVPAATKKGVIVMNTPGGNTVTTAEHALSLMMSLLRRIPQATASMKEGKWEKKKFEGQEMCGKTLGVIGMGNIGSIVADRAMGLKMKVIAYDPFISEERASEMGVELVTLEQLYSRSDIVTIHVPLIDETRNLINKETLSKFKDGAYIVCAARGGIIDEDALVEALDSGKIAGAALDVFSKEPPGQTPLVSHEKVICTPHLGASTAEAQEAVALQVAEQIVDYLTKGSITNALNVPSVAPEAAAQMQPYLKMARSLGRLQAQLGVEGMKSVELSYSGKTAEGRTALYTSAALEGLLSASLGERVNVVNASMIARERGLKVAETTAADGEDYTAMIRLKIQTTSGASSLAGAIFGKNEPRLVEMDGIPIEAVLSGHLLIFRNNDRPGLVGSIGTCLAENGINIGQMQFGRQTAGGEAVTVVNVDSPASQEVLAKLGSLPNVKSVRTALL